MQIDYYDKCYEYEKIGKENITLLDLTDKNYDEKILDLTDKKYDESILGLVNNVL